MGPLDLLAMVQPMLSQAGCSYFVTGSVAAMAFGEVRTTQDVDVVIFLRFGDLADFKAFFIEPTWYLSPEAMRDALEHDGQFNAIHVPSGMKIDFMCSDGGAFDRSRFARAKLIEIAPGLSMPFASPDDVILKKLLYYKEGGSDKHLRDIAAMMQVSPELIDRDYMQHWSTRLGVADLWAKCKQRLGW